MAQMYSPKYSDKMAQHTFIFHVYSHIAMQSKKNKWKKVHGSRWLTLNNSTFVNIAYNIFYTL